MRKLFVCFIFTMVAFPIFAQNFTGKVVDNHGVAIPFANIILLHKADSNFIAGTVSGDDGAFTISSPTGFVADELLVEFRCMGYNSVFAKPVADMGIVTLSDAVQELGEVVVKANRPIFKMQQGKMTVQVQNSILADLGDAIQVLAHLPFVSRNQDFVSVFGRGTPLIYIDNRKVFDVSDLQKLSADDIKKIQLDLNPGASYGSDVKAVIKVITHRKGEGLSAKITAREYLLKHPNTWVYSQLNYRKDKWDFFADADYDMSHNSTEFDQVIDFENAGKIVKIDQHYNSMDKYREASATAGFNFSDPDGSNFGVKYHYLNNHDGRDSLSGNTHFSENDSLLADLDISTAGKSKSDRHMVNAYYNLLWGEENMLFVNFDYINGNNEKIYFAQELDSNAVNTESLSNYELYTGKFEMSNPLFGGSLNYGAEFTFTINNFNYSRLDNGGDIVGLSQSHDQNKQLLYGLFVSQSLKFGGFSLDFGARFEFADYKYYHEKQLQPDGSDRYNRLLPYLDFTFDHEDISMSLSYRSSMRRPSYPLLNNGLVYIDRYTSQAGNSLLKSSFDYTIDYLFSWKDLSIDIMHTWFDNKMSYCAQKMDDQPAVMLTWINLPLHRLWSVDLNYSPRIGFWAPKLDLGMLKQAFEFNGKKYNKPFFNYGLNQIFTVNDYFNISLSMWGQTEGCVDLISFRNNFRSDLTFNANFFNNALTVKLMFTDIFDTDLEAHEIEINGVRHWLERPLDTRGIYFALTYNFNPQYSKYRGHISTTEAFRLQ